MKKCLLPAVATGAAVLLLTGCHSGGAYTPVNATKYNVEDTSNLVLLDSRVQRSITSPGIQQTTLPDGRLQVVANLRNREERRIQVQVQCEFKDAQGFPVDSTPWTNLILTERAQEGVTFVSMNDKAKRYTVRVREAH
jgi:uncharacterized protein YcfL